MAAIKVANYQNIVTFYTDAQTQLVGVSTYYYQAAYEIVLLQVFDPELDLLAPFYNAYLASQTLYTQSPQAIVTAIASLQNHVLAKARTGEATPDLFDTIDDWIDAAGTNGVGTNVGRQSDIDSSFQVTSEFATISEQAGFAIDDGNII